MRLLFALFSLSTLLVNAASSDDRRAISEMPITTNVLESAYFPLIQPYPGRTTNDNFRATVSTLFHGRFGETVTNLFVTNLTVINLTVVSNFFNTTTNITAYEITVTNNISHDRIFISTNITINGFDINTWTNDNTIFHPTINRGVGPGTYSFLVASNIVRVDDGRMAGTETWISKSVALNIGDNQLPVAGNSQWNLIAATSNPDDTTISLMNGITDAQKLVIYNITNAVPANGAFKLTNGTPIPDSLSGGITRLMGGRDWVATNGSWIALEFHSPDWVEMDDRNVFTGAGGADTWHVVNGILQPVDLTLPVEIDSQLNLGPGNTNVLFRIGTDLYYDNPASDHAFFVTNSASGGASFLAISSDGAGGKFQGGAVTATFGIYDGSVGLLVANNHKIIPLDSNLTDLGSRAQFWKDWYQKGSSFITGYDDQTDYSRVALHHTGTNGAFVIDSQSSGIAGSPRRVDFDFNGTNLVQVGYSGGLHGQMTFLEPGVGPTTTIGQSGGIGYLFGDSLNIIASGSGFVISSGVIQAENSNGGLLQHIGYATLTGSASLGLSHTGTNGFAIINSASNGDAGTGRPIKMQIDGSKDCLETDDNATANETRLLLWDVTAGSLRRVSIGANDSGGAGFRVLRIPN